MTRYYEKDNLIGILLIILAMAGFAIEDSIINHEPRARLVGVRTNPNFDANVYPFILRANQLVGIDSAETSIDKKSKIWKLFGSDWKLNDLELLHKTVFIDELFPEIEKMLKGEQIGRIVLKHGTSK